jgi:hypothetical protein
MGQQLVSSAHGYGTLLDIHLVQASIDLIVKIGAVVPMCSSVGGLNDEYSNSRFRR